MILGSAFALLYVKGGSTAQAGIGTTPVLMTGWASEGYEEVIIPDLAGNALRIVQGGTYLFTFCNAFSGTPNVTFTFRMRANGVESELGTKRKLGAGGDVGSCMFSAPYYLEANSRVTVYVNTDSGVGASMTPVDAYMSLVGAFRG